MGSMQAEEEVNLIQRQGNSCEHEQLQQRQQPLQQHHSPLAQRQQNISFRRSPQPGGARKVIPAAVPPPSPSSKHAIIGNIHSNGFNHIKLPPPPPNFIAGGGSSRSHIVFPPPPPQTFSRIPTMTSSSLSSSSSSPAVSQSSAVRHPTMVVLSPLEWDSRQQFLFKDPAFNHMLPLDGRPTTGAGKKNTSTNVYRMAVKRTAMSVAAAVIFGMVTWVFKGNQSGTEFFAGYLVEQSLSIDNLFVFIMLFEYFAVPLEYQDRVLTWGIVGAIMMRGIMIAAGVAVVTKFQWVTVLFAGVLLFSAWKMLTVDEEEHDLANNAVVKLAKRLVGAVDRYDDEKFFTTVSSPGGPSKRVATPLLLCLVCIELSDFVFAVDSIPAVLGVSQDPFVVYSSNIFAILALRSIYTIIARAAQQLPYLKHAVALVLAFVGLKMLLEYGGVEVSTLFSLGVVIFLLSAGVVLSLMGRFYKSRFKRKTSDSENFHDHDGDVSSSMGGMGSFAASGGSTSSDELVIDSLASSPQGIMV